jgi:hypothetical protein
MIIKYENPPDTQESVRLIKAALAKMGYDTPEKRREWYEQTVKPIVILCEQVNVQIGSNSS